MFSPSVQTVWWLGFASIYEVYASLALQRGAWHAESGLQFQNGISSISAIEWPVD